MAAVEQALQQRTVGRASTPRAAASVVAPAPVHVQRKSIRSAASRDPAERGAEAGAEQVLRTSAPPSMARFADTARLMRVVPLAPGAARSGQPELGGAGQPLSAPVRTRLQHAFGADLGAVRVHQGAAAARLAAAHGARAFAFGHNIVLGAGEQATDVSLLAHEVTHVLQQRGQPVVQKYGTTGGSAHESEARRAAETVSGGGAFAVAGRTTEPDVQREEGLIESTSWSLLQEYAPDLVPIIRKGPTGVVDWIKDKVTTAVQSFFSTVMAPVRAIEGVGASLHSQFAPLLAWMQDAAAKIARNDCRPISEAIQKIEDVAAQLITPIVEKIQGIATKVGDFFRGVWDRFGVPAVDFLKKFASAQWERLQALATWIWDNTAPVRKLADRAWTWLKNKIGIGDGPEGQNGILQWVQGKLGTAWDWLQAKLAPYKEQIQTVATVIGGVAVAVSPAGPVLLAGAAIVGVVQGVRWLKVHLAKGDAMVQARAFAEKVIIPQIMGAVTRTTAAVTKMAAAVSGKLGELSAGVGRLVGAAASTALQFIVDAATWLADKATELAAWANEKLMGIARWIGSGLERLRAFLQPVLDFLAKVGNLLVDIWGLPILLAGRIWNAIPACIRDPFVDWIIPLILRQIDFFKELVKDDEAWKKTKADVMNLIRLVFVKKDLMGAIKAAFNLLLRVFNVPVELLQQVLAKAATAWDAIMAKPVEFLKNCVRTVGRGFQLYGGELWKNLRNGFEDWLFSELGEKGIQKPKSWTDPWELAGFVCSVLGLSMSHVFDLMEQNKIFEPETVAKIRKWYARLSRAWDWVMEMRGKSPGEVTKAIISGAKDFGKSLIEGAVTWVVKKVAAELAKQAAAAAATAGLSAAMTAIGQVYAAIKTAVRWMRKILEMVNRGLDSVLNIAAGAIAPAAQILNDAMKKGTPAVIGFLAGQVGLGDLPAALGEIVDDLRKPIDKAIVAILRGVKQIIQSIVQGVKKAATAVLEWWKEKLSFRSSDGKSHTLFFSGGNDAEVMLASDPKPVKTFLQSLEGQPESKEQPHSGYIEQVNAFLETISTARARFNKATDDQKKKEAAQEIKKAFRAMHVPLAALVILTGGTKYVWIENGKRVLWSKYRPALMIRSRFYGLGHDYSKELRKHMKEEVERRTVKEGPTKDKYWVGDPRQPTVFVPLESPTHPTVEHRPSVVRHWNDGGDGSPAGRDSNQQSRFDWKNFRGRETTATILDAKTNQSLGGGGNYEYEVGPNFKGPTED